MKTKNGFTLVELIVVISILAVLALILVPSVIGYVAKAQQAVDDNNVKQLNMMTTIAATEAGKEIPQLFKDATNDNKRYQIIKNNDEAVLPKPAQSKKSFRFLTNINQWVCTSSSLNLDDKNLRDNYAIKNAFLSNLSLPFGSKDLILDLSSFDLTTYPNLKSISIPSDYRKNLNTLDSLIIEQLPGHFTSTSKLAEDKQFQISDYSFINSTIKTISLPDNIKFDVYAFQGLTSDNVSIGKFATLNSGSFREAKKIDTLTVGAGSTIKGTAIHTENGSIRTIRFGENTTFHQDAVNLNNTTSLESIEIGSNSTLQSPSIKNTNVKKIILGENVTIAENSFYSVQDKGAASQSLYKAYTNKSTGGAGTYTYDAEGKKWVKQ